MVQHFQNKTHEMVASLRSFFAGAILALERQLKDPADARPRASMEELETKTGWTLRRSTEEATEGRLFFAHPRKPGRWVSDVLA